MTEPPALAIVREAINGADWDSRGTRDRNTERAYLLTVAGISLHRQYNGRPADEWYDLAEAIADGHTVDHLPR